MNSVTTVDEMQSYLDGQEFVLQVESTTNGLLVEEKSRCTVTEASDLYRKHGYVIDQIHWETKMLHAIPITEVDDE